MTTSRPAFTKHNLTGAPSWYRLDYPDNVDAPFPLTGYITNVLPDPLLAWKADYDRFVFRLLPRVPLWDRVLLLSRPQLIRRVVLLVVAVMLIGSLAGAGMGFAFASFTQETAVFVPVVRELRFAGGGEECFLRFFMSTGTYKKVCY